MKIMLVLDASQGQNALVQAEKFHEALGLTGITVTKLDGSAKGGILLAIAHQLKVPVRFIGIGESAEDMQAFSMPKNLSMRLLGEASATAMMIQLENVTKRYPGGQEALVRSDLVCRQGRDGVCHRPLGRRQKHACCG